MGCCMSDQKSAAGEDSDVDYSKCIQGQGQLDEAPRQMYEVESGALGGHTQKRSLTPASTVDGLSEELELGMKVEASWKGGAAYPGWIINIDSRKQRYLIRYEDGEEEWTTSKRISRRFCIDERVDSRWHGSNDLYRGNIAEVNKDGTYAVQFDDGGFDPHMYPRDIYTAVDYSETSKGPLPPPGDVIRKSQNRSTPSSSVAKNAPHAVLYDEHKSQHRNDVRNERQHGRERTREKTSRSYRDQHQYRNGSDRYEGGSRHPNHYHYSDSGYSSYRDSRLM
eukprot:TRINITY_DN14247_c0_g1_i1.p1 TRINITY_DN14247_c0_g1~~TRINITY_DN14247_c0_g1_i1.p1  ORF type:complete len:280 (+),score=51.56 TRINITY_DN14247_c0_g1_i1:64-903(+)